MRHKADPICIASFCKVCVYELRPRTARRCKDALHGGALLPSGKQNIESTLDALWKKGPAEERLRSNIRSRSAIEDTEDAASIGDYCFGLPFQTTLLEDPKAMPNHSIGSACRRRQDMKAFASKAKVHTQGNQRASPAQQSPVQGEQAQQIGDPPPGRHRTLAAHGIGSKCVDLTTDSKAQHIVAKTLQS